ncbi:adenosine receptor A1-like isoform X1 [Periplaneta americana]|uniref:adenosine receptor A1-like isoform X1 n=1 Tax=Periplaneta americana TaxID=6978 RepID=UPI0037E70B3C
MSSTECLDVRSEDSIEGLHVVATRAAVDLLIVLLIVSANAFIVFAILRHQHHKNTERLSSVSVRFALSLAVSDLLVGLSTAYYLSSKYLCVVVEALSRLRFLCLFMFVMIICAHAASAYTIVVIAIDRYIAVVHALRYRELMSTRTSRIMIAIVWICSLCVSTPVFYWNNWSASEICDEILVVPVAYLPVMAILSHCLIMGIVGGFHRRIHREALASNERKRSRVSGISSFEGRNSSRFRTKSAKVLLLVTTCYVICWTPITVVMFIRGYSSQSALVDIVYNYCFTFLNINYLFNPVVYSWMNPAVRTAILDVFGICKCKKSRSSMSVEHISRQSTYPSVSTVYSVA